MKNVRLLTGVGRIGMAIARRMGYGMKIVMGEKKLGNVRGIAPGGVGVTISSQSRRPSRHCRRGSQRR